MLPTHLASGRRRCRLFIDEVGNGGHSPSEADVNGRYLSLTGIITRAADYQPKFVTVIEGLKATAFGDIGEKIILHRREILRREGVFSCLRNEEIGARFDAGLLDAVRRLPYLVATVVLDKRVHLDTFRAWAKDPYHYCLESIVERYVLWLHRQQYIGDVAIEGRGKMPDKRVKDSFRSIYSLGTANVSSDVVKSCLTSGEIKFMTKADDCAAMQLVDMLAHPSFRNMKMARLGQSAPQDFGSRIASILERCKYLRHPVTRQSEGWGKWWLPK